MSQKKKKKKDFRGVLREIKSDMEKNKAIAGFSVLIGGLAALTICVIVVFLIVVFLSPKKSSNPLNYPKSSQSSSNSNPKAEKSVVVTPPPATPAPLVQGPQTFTVQTREKPTIYELSFNTVDPQGGTQIAHVKVKDADSSVASITAKVLSDNKTQNVNLKLESGNANDGTWTASWNLNDTYNNTLKITFQASAQNGDKSSIDFSIR